ncbi:MAG: L,D-transpeptidase family protein [Bacilli bacterium]|nr:L,D-transpeptidase family protein [Bacilli bacterium]
MKKIDKKDLKKLNNTKNTSNLVKKESKKKNSASKKNKTRQVNNIKNISKEATTFEKNNKIKSNKKHATKRNNKFKLIKKIIISIIVVLLLVISLLVIYPKFKKDNEKKKLSYEVENTINLLDKEFDILSIKQDFNDDITTGELNVLEKNIEDYLLKIASLKNKVNEVVNDKNIKEILLVNDSLFDERIIRLDSSLETINGIKEEYNNIINNEVSSISSNEDINLEYLKYVSFINEKVNVDILDPIYNSIPLLKNILIFLKDNSLYYDIDESIITFNKRNVLEKYDLLVKELDTKLISNLQSRLVEDKTGPIIIASSISVYEGTNLNVKDHVKCFDEVDDLVSCTVTGEYNTNKVGEYSLLISSTDKSGNKSTKSIKVSVIKKVISPTVNSSKPYYIEVIRNQNVVVVYGKDENGNYSKIVKVFICSVGKNNYTPVGTFKTSKGYAWGSLYGGVYGQYSTRITGHILFHSVPYYTRNKGNLEWQEYNKLGTSASAGCVRMTVRDVKWIYDNVSAGTTVKIYDGALPNGVVKPTLKRIPADSPNRGWDPTDPDPSNPWNK